MVTNASAPASTLASNDAPVIEPKKRGGRPKKESAKE